MIDSWNAAKLNERITQVEKKIQANDVIANPTGAATSDLGKVSIDGDIYGVSVVKANPEGSATGTLSKVSIDGTIYNASPVETVLYENEDDTETQSAISDIDIEGYSEVFVVVKPNRDIPSYITIKLKNTDVSSKLLYSISDVYGGENTWQVEWRYKLFTISSNVLSFEGGKYRRVVDGVYTSGNSTGVMIVSKVYAY